jgi:hypothetical protein
VANGASKRKTEAPKVLPKSDVRGAMEYTLNNWTALCRYTESGWLDIDNNEGENAIRGIALGRKIGCSAEATAAAGAAAKRWSTAAIYFSLLVSCKRHGLDSWVYYRDILPRLPAMLPDASEEDLLALLPTPLASRLTVSTFLRLPRPVIFIHVLRRTLNFNQSASLIITLQRQPLLGHGGDKLQLFDVFAGERPVVQHARFPVQIPLARFRQALEHIFRVLPRRATDRTECISREPDPIGTHDILLVWCVILTQTTEDFHFQLVQNMGIKAWKAFTRRM